jgi:hypothetical protein
MPPLYRKKHGGIHMVLHMIEADLCETYSLRHGMVVGSLVSCFRLFFLLCLFLVKGNLGHVSALQPHEKVVVVGSLLAYTPNLVAATSEEEGFPHQQGRCFGRHGWASDWRRSVCLAC